MRHRGQFLKLKSLGWTGSPVYCLTFNVAVYLVVLDVQADQHENRAVKKVCHGSGSTGSSWE
jgi:hypothetical protein